MAETPLDPRVRELLDKQEIHDLLMRYCRGVDRADADLIASCYHEGAIDDHGDFIVEAKDIPPLFVALVKRSPLGGMHFIGNVLIEVEGDTAFAESYFMAIKDVARADKRFLRIRSGRYIDRLERRDDRWGIVERVLADEWNLMNEMEERLGGPEKYRFGQRDGTDPAFAIKRGRVAREKLSDLSEILSRKI